MHFFLYKIINSHDINLTFFHLYDFIMLVFSLVIH